MFCFKIGIESNDFRQIWLTRSREKSVLQKSEKKEKEQKYSFFTSMIQKTYYSAFKFWKGTNKSIADLTFKFRFGFSDTCEYQKQFSMWSFSVFNQRLQKQVEKWFFKLFS